MEEKIYWKMKDGTLIDVDEMSETHLRNTLKMILRNNKKRKEPTSTFSNSEIDAIVGSNMEPYAFDYLWK